MNNSESIPHVFDDFTFDDKYHGSVGSKSQSNVLSRLSLGLSQGDSQAWETLYMRLGDSVMTFLKKILRSDDDAFDVTQEVFISLWQNHHRIDPEKSIKGYLFKIAKSFAIDFINEKRKKNRVDAKPSFDTVELDFAPDELVMAKETQIIIGLALEMMPKQRRTVFEMSRMEGLSYDAIAAKLNLSKRTVENHVYNVTKELKELLACVMFFIMF